MKELVREGHTEQEYTLVSKCVTENVKVLVGQSCLTVCDAMDCPAYQAPLSNVNIHNLTRLNHTVLKKWSTQSSAGRGEAVLIYCSRL